MLIAKSLHRALIVLPGHARSLVPRIRSSFASGSRIPAHPHSHPRSLLPARLQRVLKEFSLVQASRAVHGEVCVLTSAHADLVRDLYERQSDKTFAEAHGSLCAFHSGLFGQSREEAEQEMMNRFLHVVSPDGAPGSACIGLRVKGGGLIGLALLEGVRGRPLVCRTHGLLVDDQHHRIGAATLLKRGQLAFAAEQGFEEALTFLHIPEIKWLKTGDEPAAMRILKRVAREAGYELFGPVAVDEYSMVISTKLNKSACGQ